ncbi:hypothetical protein [Pseudomonas sp. AP42]|uniref:hypothetical protein n=1 Tax=Pseudomonas sp. AP42 TaxID=1535632 RepID=UPI00084B5CDC|nr:hypothetical protein [Pseudomonas sp. AP42]OEC48442.1 hypothetical protein A7K61_11720 [Pseudomonas sp. AP42]
MAESKTHQRFRSRAQDLEMYLEAMDAAARVTSNLLGHAENINKDIDKALPIDCSNYTRLNHPARNRARIYNYCRAKNSHSAIVEIYGYFSEYMRDILKEIYKKDPMQVVGKSQKLLNMTFADLAKINTLGDLHGKMVEDVFRSLENERSTIKLIDKILSGTGVNLSEADKVSVLPYLEMRHLIIHNNGKIDAEFEVKYGATLKIKAGEKVPTVFPNAEAAIKSVRGFMKKVDSELVRMKLVTSNAERQ